jgi:hypothetical protein
MSKTKTFLGISPAAGVVFAAVACHPALDLQGISAGFIRCPPSQVVVGNEETHGGLREWDALYRDEEWHCVRPVSVRTSTSWVETECRRVSSDAAPPADRANASAMNTWNGEPDDTHRGTQGSPSDHQTGE